MAACDCRACDAVFTDRVASRELRRYRRRGPRKATRLLLEALLARGAAGGSLIDVGGGVGTIQHELAARGAASVVDVDASRAYLASARAEAERRGYAGRARHLLGDFAELAPDLAGADVVTLDRVVCCYADADRLVHAAATHARRLLGLVWPRDRWWAHPAAVLVNAFARLRRQGPLFYLHPAAVIEGAARRAGLERVESRTVGFWQLAVWRRAPESTGP